MKYKKIKNIDQYNEYCNIHEKLFLEEREEDQDEIDLLELLIEDYDNRIRQGKYEELNPVELLRSLLKDASLTQIQFSEQIKISRQLINDILNYRRNISKALVIKLANFFSMSQEAFSRPYYLKSEKKNFQKSKKRGEEYYKISSKKIIVNDDPKIIKKDDSTK